jgi:hypothetical protein
MVDEAACKQLRDFLVGFIESFKPVENCKAKIMGSHPKSFHGESL